MKVKELIEVLQKVDPDLPVWIEAWNLEYDTPMDYPATYAEPSTSGLPVLAIGYERPTSKRV